MRNDDGYAIEHMIDARVCPKCGAGVPASFNDMRTVDDDRNALVVYMTCPRCGLRFADVYMMHHATWWKED